MSPLPHAFPDPESSPLTPEPTTLFRRLLAGGIFPAFIATALWSTVFVLARSLAGQVPPAELSFWRWFIALLAMLVFSHRHCRRDMTIIRQHAGFLLLTGILGFGIFSLVVFKAGESTSATNLSLIAASAPVAMALLSVVLLHERLNMRQIVGLCIALGGVLVLVFKGDVRNLTQLAFTPGDLWMLLASLMFAVYSILVRRKPANLSQESFLTAMLGFASLFLAPLCLWNMFESGYRLPSAESWLAMLFMGIGPSSLAYFCWNIAVARIGAARSGVVYYSVPLFSSLEAGLLLGESVTLAQIAGGVLILGGIFISSLDSLRKRPSAV